MFSPDRSFFTPVSLSKRFVKFSEILHEIIKKKFQVKFLRDFSGEMFNSVRFTHEIKSSECFFDRFHTHTIFYKFSPNCFPLTWRKKKYLHFCCHSKLFSWKKKSFFSLSFTLEKTKFSWKCVYTQFHKRGNKIQSHMKEKKSPENSPDCFLLLGFTHKKISPENNFKLKKPPKVKFLKITHKINSNEKHFQSGSHMET